MTRALNPLEAIMNSELREAVARIIEPGLCDGTVRKALIDAEVFRGGTELDASLRADITLSVAWSKALAKADELLTLFSERMGEGTRAIPKAIEALKAEFEWHELRWDLSMDAAREATVCGTKADEMDAMRSAALHHKRMDAITEAIAALAETAAAGPSEGGGGNSSSTTGLPAHVADATATEAQHSAGQSDLLLLCDEYETIRTEEGAFAEAATELCAFRIAEHFALIRRALSTEPQPLIGVEKVGSGSWIVTDDGCYLIFPPVDKASCTDRAGAPACGAAEDGSRKSEESYRGFRIDYDPPPIPVRDCDWHWTHEDYDGPEDNRYGHAPSLEAAKADIDFWHEENGDAVEADKAEGNWKAAAKDLIYTLANERDRSIRLRTELITAREYVVDALDAHEHSDGRELLQRIDVALSEPASVLTDSPCKSEGEAS